MDATENTRDNKVSVVTADDYAKVNWATGAGCHRYRNRGNRSALRGELDGCRRHNRI